MSERLLIISDMEAGEPFEIWIQPPGRAVRRGQFSGAVVIGRDDAADVVLDSPFVSRRHARIDWVTGKHVLSDLTSRNGTWLNGKRIEKASELRAGDEIGVAEYVLFYRHAPNAGETRDWDKSLLSEGSSQVALYVDRAAREVWVLGEKLGEPLPKLEFELLSFLYQRTGEVVPLDEIGAAIWGRDAYDRDMLHQLVSRLKRRVEPDRLQPRFIINVRGVGYQLHRSIVDDPPVSQP
jgi:hypothetical protein